MKYLTLLLCVFPFTAVLAAPGAHGPDGEHLDATPSVASSALARLADGSVNVPIKSQRLMQVRTILAPLGQGRASVQLPAQVIANPNFAGVVQSGQRGRLEPGKTGFPLVGQRVQKGEIIGWIRFATDSYAEAAQQAKLAELSSELTIAQQRVARLAELSGSVPRKDIEAAQATLRGLEAQHSSFKQSLSRREALKAPVTGIISAVNAQAGQVIEAGQTLFSIVAPNQLLIEARTNKADLVEQIHQAFIASSADSKLKLVGAGGMLINGLLPITFEAINNTGLVIGQPVTVIATLKENRSGIVLPAEALVKGDANEDQVWIKVSAERFLPQMVKFEYLDARSVLVTAGLAADNRVVVQGASLLNQIR